MNLLLTIRPHCVGYAGLPWPVSSSVLRKAHDMTRRELVRAAIQHRETERVPYAIDFTGEADERLRNELGIEDVDAWRDNDVIYTPAPWWGWNYLGEDWAQPETPTSLPSCCGVGSYDGLEDRYRELREKSDKYFLVCIYGSHFEKAYFARGIENLLADIAGDYAFAKKLHTTIIDRNLVMLENLLSIPEIDGVLLGSDWGSQRGLLMSPAVWEDMNRPGEQREYDLIHAYGKDVWVHSCGRIDAIIPSLVEMGLDVLNPVQPECMDLRQLKDDFGDKLAFWGGISTQQTLPYGTADELRAEARATRDLLSKGGGYIYSAAQSVQGDVPVANIQALLEVAREKRW